ncbi:hypothetical protein ACVI1J_002923 [Bradyrhizobium diazoefficiens]
MLAAQIGDRHAGLMLLQNPDDLLFRKAAALHALVLVVGQNELQTGSSPRGKVRTNATFSPLTSVCKSIPNTRAALLVVGANLGINYGLGCTGDVRFRGAMRKPGSGIEKLANDEKRHVIDVRVGKQRLDIGCNVTGMAGTERLCSFYLSLVVSKKLMSDLIIGSLPSARPGSLAEAPLTLALKGAEGEGTPPLNASKVTNITKSRPSALEC